MLLGYCPYTDSMARLEVNGRFSYQDQGGRWTDAAPLEALNKELRAWVDQIVNLTTALDTMNGNIGSLVFKTEQIVKELVRLREKKKETAIETFNTLYNSGNFNTELFSKRVIIDAINDLIERTEK